MSTQTLAYDIIHAIARVCARDALAMGAERRPLRDDEDALPGDYAALEEAIGQPLAPEGRRLFRDAYSAELAGGAS